LRGFAIGGQQLIGPELDGDLADLPAEAERNLIDGLRDGPLLASHVYAYDRDPSPMHFRQ
jgi:hypothetical protein